MSQSGVDYLAVYKVHDWMQLIAMMKTWVKTVCSAPGSDYNVDVIFRHKLWDNPPTETTFKDIRWMLFTMYGLDFG